MDNMSKDTTRGLTSVQKRELWERWKKGQSLSEIGRALGKHAGAGSTGHCNTQHFADGSGNWPVIPRTTVPVDKLP